MHSQIHENQKQILEFLFDHEEGATLEQLAMHLGVTKTAAKEHIVKIERLGLLTFKDQRGFIGRPRRTYLLSKEGQEALPRHYSWLSTLLLEFLSEDLGAAEAARIMKGLAHKVAKSLGPRFEKIDSTPERLAELSRVLNELGYRSVVKQSDVRKGAIIEATNCVYHSVAKAHPELCQFDLELIKQVSGGLDVKLEACIARGGTVCRFCLRKA